jgi:CBS domain-containing protein
MFPSAGAELRIALAGPAVSALLGGAFVAIAALVDRPHEVDGVAAWLGYINFFLLAFNLLPALPLDGGRVFRALFWRAKGDFAAATRIAAAVGRGFGLLLIGVGLALFVAGGSWSGAWMAFLGWFLFQAATAEAQAVVLREALGGLRVADVMARSPVTVSPDVSLERFVDDTAFAHRYTTYPVVDDGGVVGLLPFARVAAVPRTEWARVPVRDRMVRRPETVVVRPDDDLLDALGAMSTGGLNRALVLDGERLSGLLSMTDVARLVAQRAALQS